MDVVDRHEQRGLGGVRPQGPPEPGGGAPFVALGDEVGELVLQAEQLPDGGEGDAGVLG